MTNAQIDYEAEAGRTSYTYRPRMRITTPQVWLWAAAGGLALGVAGAVANAVFELTDALSFGALLSLLATAAAVGLVVLARLTTRSVVALHVSFDVLAGMVEVYRRHAEQEYTRFPLAEVVEFVVDRRREQGQRVCVLAMLTTRYAVPLLTVRGHCPRHSGVPDLAHRLNMAREVALNDMRSVPARPEQHAAYVAPSVLRPARPMNHPPAPPRQPQNMPIPPENKRQ